jgi:hypothetical protein
LASFPLLSVASDPATITTSLANLGQQVHKTRDALSKYDGGILSTLPLAAELYRVMVASNDARRSFEDSDPIPADEVPQIMEQYHNVRVAIEEGLKGIPAKVRGHSANLLLG